MVEVVKYFKGSTCVYNFVRKSCSSMFNFDFRLNVLVQCWLSSMLILPIYVVRMIFDYSFIHSFIHSFINDHFLKEVVLVFQYLCCWLFSWALLSWLYCWLCPKSLYYIYMSAFDHGHRSSFYVVNYVDEKNIRVP